MTTVLADSLRPTRISTRAVAGAEITLADRDRTRPFLLLHGGAGPGSMTGFADLLAERTHSRVLLPTHPGFSGTPRPGTLGSTRDLAAAYVELLEQLDLSDVTVVGNSYGGWVAAEIGLARSPRVSGAVIIDGIGIEVDGHPMTSVAGLTSADLLRLSFHDSSKAPRPPAGSASGPSPDLAALAAYAGPTMSDPTLLARLGTLDLPVHVIWGESDGIVGPEYGRAYADALPESTFTLLPRAGHLPQLESPEELLGAIFDLGR
ncbi:alpha/beta fold hydrolase [Plantactinospora siamensis]|uniref:Alpha/beta fold hydrolase n=1 Tax=Plantactinospora siamensis TaxID=555372 RepID=A0ABV6P5H8_9ACTN